MRAPTSTVHSTICSEMTPVERHISAIAVFHLTGCGSAYNFSCVNETITYTAKTLNVREQPISVNFATRKIRELQWPPIFLLRVKANSSL